MQLLSYEGTGQAADYRDDAKDADEEKLKERNNTVPTSYIG